LNEEDIRSEEGARATLASFFSIIYDIYNEKKGFERESNENANKADILEAELTEIRILAEN
jgi:hypothetical protein